MLAMRNYLVFDLQTIKTVAIFYRDLDMKRWDFCRIVIKRDALKLYSYMARNKINRLEEESGITILGNVG